MKKLLSPEYFDEWKAFLTEDIPSRLSMIGETGLEPNSFTFYTSVSVMSSSKIEGERLEIDSYVKHKLLDVEYLLNLTEKPNDLYNAYLFAKENGLSTDSFLQAHRLITAHLLPPSGRGVLRTTEMLVMEHNTGRIQYEAAPQRSVSALYGQLSQEIDELLKAELSLQEVFYYAAFIHLVFVNIHPFADGNGRIARLLEKWFLAEKLGEKAWLIQSEQYYYRQVANYYKNLAALGTFYDTLHYQRAIPFLLMLPQSLNL